MKERAFKAHPYEVRAILAGTQTQFRRVVKYPCYFTGGRVHPAVQRIVHRKNGWFGFEAPEHVKQQYISTFPLRTIRCPYGQAADRLWVRETFQQIWDPEVIRTPESEAEVHISAHEQFQNWETRDKKPAWGTHVNYWVYRADGEADHTTPLGALRWQPSTRMPRAASRITLEITGVRVERLQEISESDAKAEGVEKLPPNKFKNYLGKEYGQGINLNYAAESYRTLWDSINAERGYGWSTNPFVWVIEFRRLT